MNFRFYLEKMRVSEKIRAHDLGKPVIHNYTVHSLDREEK